jgi:hypothetical protein
MLSTSARITLLAPNSATRSSSCASALRVAPRRTAGLGGTADCEPRYGRRPQPKSTAWRFAQLAPAPVPAPATPWSGAMPPAGGWAMRGGRKVVHP